MLHLRQQAPIEIENSKLPVKQGQRVSPPVKMTLEGFSVVSLKRRLDLMMSRIIIILLGVFLISGCASPETRRKQIRSQHPQWDETTIQKVAAREVEAGMTPEMVEAALGKPDAVSHEGDQEIWGYEIIIDSFAYARRKLVYFVHFKEGRVVRTTGDRDKLPYPRQKKSK
jgi:outer membrane protein assembly factor BamE (lipoprotein component of BamABCDE complex)